VRVAQLVKLEAVVFVLAASLKTLGYLWGVTCDRGRSPPN